MNVRSTSGSREGRNPPRCRADPAAQLRPREVALSALVDLENALGELDHGVTVRCRHDRMVSRTNSRRTNLFFELANVLADRRLLQAELDGRLREAAV